MHGDLPGRVQPTVLVGNTLGPESDAVMRAALALARHSGGKVLVLHVLEPQGKVAAGLLGFSMVRKGVSAAACERLSGQLRRLGAKSSEVADIAVEVPPVGRALLRAVKRSRAGWLVLGANGQDLRLPRIGSVPMKLLRRSPRPLWLVRGQGPLIPTRVLLPIGLAPPPAELLRRCLEVSANGFPVAETEVIAVRVLAEDDPRQAIDAAQELDRVLASQATSFAGHLRGIVRRGSLAQAVVAAVAEERADLVLLAMQAPTGSGPCAADPVVEAVASQTGCALLLVPS